MTVIMVYFGGIGGMVSDYLCNSDHGLVIMVYFQGDRMDGE